MEKGRRAVRQPCHESVAEELRIAMATGRLQPGRRLPSQRRLAEEFEVSRTTIVMAFAVLLGEGLIEVRRGAGSWVREPAADPEDTVGEHQPPWLEPLLS